MISTRKFAAVFLTLLAGAAAVAFTLHAQPQPQIPQPAQPPDQISQRAQPPSTPRPNPAVILLDPAHGGPDSGATLANNILEKDVTLAFALRLRAALTAAGFTVVATRDSDLTDALTPDQRAEIANRTHALACLVFHATASGSGVHLYTSTLQPPAPQDSFGSSSYVPVPWDTAQAASVEQSRSLAAGLSSALTKGNLPVLSGQAAVRPLDNLMCPAVAVELAPLQVSGEDSTAPTDPAYQQRVATALTLALQSWRDQAAAPAASLEDSGPARAIAAANAVGVGAATSHASPAPIQRGAP